MSNRTGGVKPAIRREAEALFGKLLRTLDRMGIGRELEPEMQRILSAIRGCEDDRQRD
jgi:hypothetical protein